MVELSDNGDAIATIRYKVENVYKTAHGTNDIQHSKCTDTDTDAGAHIYLHAFKMIT